MKKYICYSCKNKTNHPVHGAPYKKKDEENEHWLRFKERENNSYFFINKLSSCLSIGMVPNFVI